MRVTIDTAKCVAAGQCVLEADAVFAQRDEDGIAYLLLDEIPLEREADVRNAYELCPSMAIDIED